MCAESSARLVGAGDDRSLQWQAVINSRRCTQHAPLECAPEHHCLTSQFTSRVLSALRHTLCLPALSRRPTIECRPAATIVWRKF